jgi:hypothetical protein
MNRKEYLKQFDLWAEADFAGDKAAMAVLPNPMYVTDGNGNEFFVSDGLCGFASIHFKSARSKFVSYLKEDNMGYKPVTMTGYRLPVNEYGQSYERSKAYAEAFVEVLRKHGIECYADSRLD